MSPLGRPKVPKEPARPRTRIPQLRNLQSLVEIGVDKNTTVVFLAPLMSTIGELGSFLARETAAASQVPAGPAGAEPAPTAVSNGAARNEVSS